MSELRRRTKIGTAFAAITTLVCRDEPDAMFVNTQAASNC